MKRHPFQRSQGKHAMRLASREWPRLPLDMTGCNNMKCPLRLRCLRNSGVSNLDVRSWCDFVPDHTGRCEYFIEVK